MASRTTTSRTQQLFAHAVNNHSKYGSQSSDEEYSLDDVNKAVEDVQNFYIDTHNEYKQKYSKLLPNQQHTIVAKYLYNRRSNANNNSPTTGVSAATAVTECDTKHSNTKLCQHMHQQKTASSDVSVQTNNDGGAIIKTNNDANGPSPHSIHIQYPPLSTSSKTIPTNNTKADTSSSFDAFTNATQLNYSAIKNDTSISKDNSKLSSPGLWSGSGAAKYRSDTVSGSPKIESRKQKGARASPPRMGTRSTRSKTTTRLHDENNINGTKSPGKKAAVKPPPSEVFSPHKSTTHTLASIPKTCISFDSVAAPKEYNNSSNNTTKHFGNYVFRGYDEELNYQCKESNIVHESEWHDDIDEKDSRIKSEMSHISKGKTPLKSADFSSKDYHERCIEDAERDVDNVDKDQFVIATGEGTKKGDTVCTNCFGRVCCYNCGAFVVSKLTTHASRDKCKTAKRLRKEKGIVGVGPNEKIRLRLALAEKSYPAIKGMFSPIDGSTVKCRCGNTCYLREGKSVDPKELSKHILTKTCQRKRGKVSSS